MLTKRQRLLKSVKKLRNRLTPVSAPAVPVFVLGEMRSGTNMLTEAFERTARTEVFNENDEAAFSAFELRDLGTIGALISRSAASHVVFKPIADSGRARELLQRFPGSKIVWIYRRYQDVVNSALRQWQNHREYIRVVLEEPERARWRRRDLVDSQLALLRRFYSPTLSNPSARSLIWHIRNEHFFLQELDRSEDVLLVNYEDLVHSPGTQLRLAFDFVGLPVSKNSFRHMSTDSIGRDESPPIDPQIQALCDALLLRLHGARRHSP